MSTINLQAIRQELTVFFRNANIISVATRGVITRTEDLTLQGPQTVFVLKNTGVKNVRSVDFNGSPLSLGKDYTVNYHGGVVTLLVTTAASDTVQIVYDSGEKDRIHPDFPRGDIDLATSYPRVGFEDISHANTEQALNAELIRTDILFSLIVYAKRKDTVLEIWQLARDAIIANKKTFFSFVTLAGAGPLAMSAGRSDKIIQKNMDFRIPYEFETG